VRLSAIRGSTNQSRVEQSELNAVVSALSSSNLASCFSQLQLLWDLIHQLDCAPLLMLICEVLEQEGNCNTQLQVVVPTSSSGIYF